jgi:hypothetical protein
VPLEILDERHRQAAVGYAELGMYLEADAELDKIDPFCRAAPEVLAVRLGIYAGLKKWELMQVVAEKLVLVPVRYSFLRIRERLPESPRGQTKSIDQIPTLTWAHVFQRDKSTAGAAVGTWKPDF